MSRRQSHSSESLKKNVLQKAGNLLSRKPATDYITVIFSEDNSRMQAFESVLMKAHGLDPKTHNPDDGLPWVVGVGRSEKGLEVVYTIITEAMPEPDEKMKKIRKLLRQGPTAEIMALAEKYGGRCFVSSNHQRSLQ